MATFTTPVTLLEAARTGKLTQIDSALVQTFMQDQTKRPGQLVNFFDVFPFQDVPGALEYTFQRELGLPTITPRVLNSTVTRSVASTEMRTEALKIYPAEFIIDKALLRTNAGTLTANTQFSMHAKAILSTYQNHLFKGDAGTTQAQVTGLQQRCVGTQLVTNGSTNGGDALSIAKLRSAIDLCYGENRVIVCGKGMARRLDAAVALTTVGATIREDMTMWGVKARTFDGIPIIPIADFYGTDNILDFTETGDGGATATATSIYILSLGSDGVMGLRNGGLLDWSLPSGAAGEQANIYDMMFLGGLAVKRPQAAVRLYGISDAAAVT